jgi:hypothetical protein
MTLRLLQTYIAPLVIFVQTLKERSAHEAIVDVVLPTLIPTRITPKHWTVDRLLQREMNEVGTLVLSTYIGASIALKALFIMLNSASLRT